MVWSRSLVSISQKIVSTLHCSHGLLKSSKIGSSLHSKSFLLTNKPMIKPFLFRTFATKQTEGDRDLVNFLKEEISYEQDNLSELPKFKDFKVQISGTEVKLFRNLNNEKIEVEFDINENVNIDEGILKEDGDESEENSEDHEITSYPSFSVKITKPSGKILHFNCVYNTNHNEELDVESEEDEQFELFRFENVKVYTDSEKNVYEAETETMDGELYSMLMTTLLERGVDGVFVNSLLDLSTTLEHKQYISFLQSLQDFAAGK
ncbi:complement component 1 Q subcomponent-binding protein, mitochondrial isoform X2 [Hydra vulgaris]|uniref:Complement component 1 Q subcomponent-binding protein, mitochondrial isoform X2 n=1 Tax=Hydra vulgaris TaxID=6087 RepID=A0ABM4CP06_HYDVU